jgi:CheY-like chemotaxis protein
MPVHSAPSHSAPLPAQRVVLVNGDPSVLRLLDTVLAAGHYDMVFVPPDGRAYEQIRNIQPDLVILRTDLRNAADLQVLTMLKLDPATGHIPVMTVATDDAPATATEPEDLPAPQEAWTHGPDRPRLN